MENPEPLAGLHIEAAHKSFGCRASVRASCREVGRAHDHDFSGDERRGIEAHGGRGEVVFLVIVDFQIHDTILAEGVNEFASPGIERDHAVSGCDIEDSLIGAVGTRPVRYPAACGAPRRRIPARPFVLAVHPQHFACSRIEGNRGAACAGSRVEHSVHIKRRCRIEVIRRGAKEVGLKTPGDSEIPEVVFVDLIEWRVPMAREVSAIRGPVGACRGDGSRVSAPLTAAPAALGKCKE